MFPLAIVLGLMAGVLRGGRVGRLAEVGLEGTGWLALAFAVRLLLSRAGTAGWDGLAAAAPLALGASYLALLGVAVANRRHTGMVLVALGTGLNLVAIALNGWRMPVSPAALAAAGGQRLLPALAAGADPVHRLLGPDTDVPFLTDILALPPPFPLPEVFSPGDALVSLGVFLFIQRGMLPPAR